MGVAADVLECDQYQSAATDGANWRALQPDASGEEARVPYVSQNARWSRRPGHLRHRYIKSYRQQIRPIINKRFVGVGYDGFGRSDTRSKLRHHFEGGPPAWWPWPH